jgi:hypothetical protein
MSTATVSRSQTRGIKATSKMLGSNAEVAAYALGRAHARMPRWVVVTMLTFGALFVLAIVLAHTVIYPGALLLVALAYGIRPLRAVAVAQGSLVVMSRSAWSGKHSLLGVMPLENLRPLEDAKTGGRVKVALGPDVVSLRRKDFDRLMAAAEVAGAVGSYPFASGVAVAAPPAAAPAGWYPDPSSPQDQAKRRYWDGATWTSAETS